MPLDGDQPISPDLSATKAGVSLSLYGRLPGTGHPPCSAPGTRDTTLGPGFLPGCLKLSWMHNTWANPQPAAPNPFGLLKEVLLMPSRQTGEAW